MFLLGVLIVLSGCNYGLHENSTTYFGGKIKNPVDKYVYFSKNDKVIDSAKIDENNKFSFDLDSIEIGLYTFNHGPEFQYIYLEPKDSLLIYLNTWDFDESFLRNACNNTSTQRRSEVGPIAFKVVIAPHW